MSSSSLINTYATIISVVSTITLVIAGSLTLYITLRYRVISNEEYLMDRMRGLDSYACEQQYLQQENAPANPYISSSADVSEQSQEETSPNSINKNAGLEEKELSSAARSFCLEQQEKQTLSRRRLQWKEQVLQGSIRMLVGAVVLGIHYPLMRRPQHANKG